MCEKEIQLRTTMEQHRHILCPQGNYSLVGKKFKRIITLKAL